MERGCFRTAHPELKNALLAIKNSPTGFLNCVQPVSAELNERAIARAVETCMGTGGGKEMSGQRFMQLLFGAGAHFFSEHDTLKALDLEVALHSYRDDVIKVDAIKEATKALRRKCIEKRVQGGP